MIRKRTQQLERTRSRLDKYTKEERIASDDADLLDAFDTKLDADGEKGDSRHGQLLEYGTNFAIFREEHGIALALLLTNENDAGEQFETWINTHRKESGEKLARKTRIHYRGFARQFGKLMTDGDDVPSYLQEISVPKPKEDSKNPAPSPSDVLRWAEHILQILASNEVHLRDKALCAVYWDAGARPWEIEDALLGHLEDKGDYIYLEIVDGKTGNRDTRLVPSAPWLRMWIEEHPINEELRDDENPIEDAPNTPLWSKQDSPEKYKDPSEIPKRIGNRVGISRPTNARNFRKSRASILAADPEVAEHSLRIRFGWEENSNAPGHYKARYGKKADQQISNADGADLDLTEDRENIAPVECPRCGRWTTRSFDCIWCNAPFDVEEAEKEAETVLNTDLRQKKREFLRAVAEGDFDLEHMEESEPFLETIHDDPDLIDKAERFLNEVEDADMDD